MATVGKELADEIAANNGVYKTDTPVRLIIQYDNAWEGQGYGLVYEGGPNRYTPSEYIRSPRVYFQRVENFKGEDHGNEE